MNASSAAWSSTPSLHRSIHLVEPRRSQNSLGAQTNAGLEAALESRRAAEPRTPSLGELPPEPELPGFVLPVVTASGLWPPTDEDLNLGPRPQPPRQEDLDNPPQYQPPVRIN